MCSSDLTAIAVRKPLHQRPQLRALAALHTRGYLLLNGQSSHGIGQFSPHRRLHRKLFPAHASAGKARAAISATHLSLMSTSSRDRAPCAAFTSSRRETPPA